MVAAISSSIESYSKGYYKSKNGRNMNRNTHSNTCNDDTHCDVCKQSQSGNTICDQCMDGYNLFTSYDTTVTKLYLCMFCVFVFCVCQIFCKVCLLFRKLCLTKKRILEIKM